MNHLVTLTEANTGRKVRIRADQIKGITSANRITNVDSIDRVISVTETPKEIQLMQAFDYATVLQQVFLRCIPTGIQSPDREGRKLLAQAVQCTRALQKEIEEHIEETS